MDSEISKYFTKVAVVKCVGTRFSSLFLEERSFENRRNIPNQKRGKMDWNQSVYSKVKRQN